MNQRGTSPLQEHDPSTPSVFLPKNLLNGARRYKNLPERPVPVGCLLDMDGELLDRLVETGRASLDKDWPCFHTRLYRWTDGDSEFGVIGGTVGAPFAVLVAEELFASGCEALVSISSAGLISADAQPPFFVLIDRALRDEGTSHHYLAPNRYAEADGNLVDAVASTLIRIETSVLRGASWTTDAPFREAEALIKSRRAEGIISVEMEASALLAMGRALVRPVVCLAHVTNTMATGPTDFEKGGNDGQEESLDVCAHALRVVIAYAHSPTRAQGNLPPAVE